MGFTLSHRQTYPKLRKTIIPAMVSPFTTISKSKKKVTSNAMIMNVKNTKFVFETNPSHVPTLA